MLSYNKGVEDKNEGFRNNIMLTEMQRQFIFKRSLFQRVSGYISWSIGLSALAAWGLIYWLKPVLVSPQVLLQQLKANTLSQQELAEIAVTGTAAISALFIFIIFYALSMLLWSKKEKKYLDIIEQQDP